MKRFILSLLTFCVFSLYLYAQTPTTPPVPIPLIPQISDKPNQTKPNMPAKQLKAWISGNMITLSDHNDLYIEVIQDDVIVFTDFVPYGANTILLPNDLSGEFTISIQLNNRTYIGIIYL